MSRDAGAGGVAAAEDMAGGDRRDPGELGQLGQRVEVEDEDVVAVGVDEAGEGGGGPASRRGGGQRQATDRPRSGGRG